MTPAICLALFMGATAPDPAHAPSTSMSSPATASALPSAWRAPDTGADSGVFAGGQLFAGFDAPLSPAQATVWPRFVLERVEVGGGVIDVVVAVTNGEGKNELELNPGKNLTVIVGSTPLRLAVFDEPLALSVAGAWRDGSVGVSSTRDHRGLLALTASHPWFHVGAEGVWALGVDGRGDREVLGGGAWADAPLWPGWLGAVVRADVLHDVVADSDGATTTDVLAGLFTDFGHAEVEGRREGSVLRRLRLYLTGGLRTTSGEAAIADDAATAWRVLATVELTGLTDIIALPPPAPSR